MTEEEKKEKKPNPPQKASDEPPPWIETLVKLGKLVGMNEVRLRWRLHKWDEERKKEDVSVSREDKPQANQYFYKRREQRERQEFINGITASKVLAIIILFCYIRTVAEARGSIFSFSSRTLFDLGANTNFEFYLLLGNKAWKENSNIFFQWLRWGGEYWRLSSCVFLHGGIFHIGFNMYALFLLGPYVEETFGRFRMVTFFVVTGLFASLFSSSWNLLMYTFKTPQFARQGMLIGIGASGAILGLIGVAAGWGHREKTPRAIAVRNTMIQWTLYTVVFGFLIRADNVAHIAGFLTGAILGYVLHPLSLEKNRNVGPFTILLFIPSAAIIICTCLLIFFPQSSATRFEKELTKARLQYYKFAPPTPKRSSKVPTNKQKLNVQKSGSRKVLQKDSKGQK